MEPFDWPVHLSSASAIFSTLEVALGAGTYQLNDMQPVITDGKINGNLAKSHCKPHKPIHQSIISSGSMFFWQRRSTFWLFANLRLRSILDVGPTWAVSQPSNPIAWLRRMLWSHISSLYHSGVYKGAMLRDSCFWVFIGTTSPSKGLDVF